MATLSTGSLLIGDFGDGKINVGTVTTGGTDVAVTSRGARHGERLAGQCGSQSGLDASTVSCWVARVSAT